MHATDFRPYARATGLGLLLLLWILTTGAESGSLPELPGWLLATVTGIAGALVLWGRTRREVELLLEAKQVTEAALKEKVDGKELEALDRRLTDQHNALHARLSEVKDDITTELRALRDAQR